ncbi:hypothetical protein GCM10019016_127260 [Streptomyces prasinosporus]|uniref:Uncharacterized protein n=1 Tax=Streptomyces prasinosporus TaxID=68256 RepID=A0ABP6UFT7_9ACTN
MEWDRRGSRRRIVAVRRTTVNLKGYVVKDAVGNRFVITASHYLQPDEFIKLRGGRGAESDANWL